MDVKWRSISLRMSVVKRSIPTLMEDQLEIIVLFEEICILQNIITKICTNATVLKLRTACLLLDYCCTRSSGRSGFFQQSPVFFLPLQQLVFVKIIKQIHL